MRLSLAALALIAATVAPAPSFAGEESPTGLDLRAPDGRRVALSAPAGGAAAVVFLSADCPISNASSPALNAIAAAFPAGKVRLVGVYVDPDLTDAQAASHAEEYRLAFPVA